MLLADWRWQDDWYHGRGRTQCSNIIALLAYSCYPCPHYFWLDMAWCYSHFAWFKSQFWRLHQEVELRTEYQVFHQLNCIAVLSCSLSFLILVAEICRFVAKNQEYTVYRCTQQFCICIYCRISHQNPSKSRKVLIFCGRQSHPLRSELGALGAEDPAKVSQRSIEVGEGVGKGMENGF